MLMKIKEIMSSTIIFASPKSTFREVWKLLFKKHINALPVVDKKKKIVGIITKEDMLKSFYPDFNEFMADVDPAQGPEEVLSAMEEMFDKQAEHLMQRSVVFTRPDTDVMRALARMIARRVNQLPVVSEEDKLVGMVTKNDVFYSLYGIGKKLVRKKKE